MLTMPASKRCATRNAVLRFSVKTLELRPNSLRPNSQQPNDNQTQDVRVVGKRQCFVFGFERMDDDSRTKDFLLVDSGIRRNVGKDSL